jgi:hypothetical protein
VTVAVWKEINAIPPRLEGVADVRGRAHDVLWMAAIAARGGGGSEATFTVQMGVGRSKWQEYRVVMSPEGPEGAGCVTIMKPGEDWGHSAAGRSGADRFRRTGPSGKRIHDRVFDRDTVEGSLRYAGGCAAGG